MSEKKETALGNAVVYGGFQALILLGSLVSFPILTRALSVSEYGMLALANTTVIILVALAKSGSATSFLRHHAKATGDGESAVAALCATTFWTILSIAAILCLITVLITTQTDIGRSLISSDVLLVVAILLVSGAMRDTAYAMYRAEETAVRANLVWTAFKLGGVAGGLVSMFLSENGVRGFLTGMLVVELSVGVFAWARYAKKGYLAPLKYSKSIVRSLMVYGGPLLIYESAYLLNDYIDRYLVATLLGLSEVGIYSVGYNLGTYVQAIFIAPMWLAVFPIYTRMWEQEGRDKTEKFLSNGLTVYAAVACGVVLLVGVAGPQLVTVLATDKYASAGWIFQALTATLLFHGASHFLGAGFHLERKTTYMAALTLVAAVINIILNLIMIPRYGLAGAVYSSVGSFVFLTLSLAFFGARFVTVRIAWSRIVVFLLSAGGVGLAAGALKFDSNLVSLLVRGTLSAAAYTALLWFFDREIRGGMKAGYARLTGLLARN